MLSSDKPLPAALVWDWMHQVANGMHFLHSNRIVHRDLKSPNILIGHNYVLKISDFGSARSMDSGASTRMSFAGTVAWMAPEVVRNEPCSDKVDVWSFGVIVWELLTGATPYLGIESAVLIMGIGYGRFALPVPASMPDGCRLLMRQCWDPKPRNRPTFRQILMHLEILSDELLNSEKFSDDTAFHKARSQWRENVTKVAQATPSVDGSTMMKQNLLNGNFFTDGWVDGQQAELVKKREEELRHVQEIRQLYEEKLRRVQALYLDLSSCMLSVRDRELDLDKREAELKREANRLRQQQFISNNPPITPSSFLSQQLSLPPQSSATEHLDDKGSVTFAGRFSHSANNGKAGNPNNPKLRLFDQHSRPLSALNLFGAPREAAKGGTHATTSGKKFVRRSFATDNRPRSSILSRSSDLNSTGVFTIQGADFSRTYHDYGGFSLPTKTAAPLPNQPRISSTSNTSLASSGSSNDFGSTYPQVATIKKPLNHSLNIAALPSPVAEVSEDNLLADQEELVKEMKRQLSARSLARLTSSSKRPAEAPVNLNIKRNSLTGDTDSGVAGSPCDEKT